jgi:hypothetical protein
VIDDVVEGFEDSVRQPVLSHERRRNRKQSARLRRILHPLRNSPNAVARIVRPHHNGSPHGNDPPFATLNHFTGDPDTHGHALSLWSHAPASSDCEDR